MKVGVKITGLSFDKTLEGLPDLLNEVARKDGRRIGNAVARKIKPAVPERTGVFRRQFRSPLVRRVGSKFKVRFRNLDRRKFPALWGYVPRRGGTRAGGRRWRKSSEQNRRILRAYDEAFRVFKAETTKAVVRRGLRMGLKGGRDVS